MFIELYATPRGFSIYPTCRKPVTDWLELARDGRGELRSCEGQTYERSVCLIEYSRIRQLQAEGTKLYDRLLGPGNYFLGLGFWPWRVARPISLFSDAPEQFRPLVSGTISKAFTMSSPSLWYYTAPELRLLYPRIQDASWPTAQELQNANVVCPPEALASWHELIAEQRDEFYGLARRLSRWSETLLRIAPQASQFD